MENNGKIYIAIDLKSFYASVECRERGLDPLKTNLVVADPTRTEKTICLAVTPSLKKFGIPGRARLFEVVQKVREINRKRQYNAPNRTFTGSSVFEDELQDKSKSLDYLIAPPRMSLYMKYSTRIYQIYLKYVAPEDIHPYSIDEVFIDATDYCKLYSLSGREFASKMIKDVLSETGITATAGIGTNLYLCKIAMDIEAKHITADKDGVRIAELDEMSYRKKLWSHRPITDFWRVGAGYRRRLEENGLYTMGDIARCSIGSEKDYYNEDLLYKLFGVNAELLIDHAWGYEPCTMKEIKSYKPESTSLSSGQVLHCAYTYEKTKLIVREMVELLVLDLIEKKLVTNQVVLNIGYDVENISDYSRREKYKGEVTTDWYGRAVPKQAHGSKNLNRYTSSLKLISKAFMELFEEIVNPDLLVRRLNVIANNTLPEDNAPEPEKFEQLDLFTNYAEADKQKQAEEKELEKEKRRQKAVLDIGKKYGKNAILKGMNFEAGGTTKERNGQIGGHKE